MGDSATAMRDPVFYKWHAFINDIFLEHKNTLPAYGVDQVHSKFVCFYSVTFIYLKQNLLIFS